MNMSKEKENPFAADSPSDKKQTVPTDSLNPKPDIVMGTFPINIIMGAVTTVLRLIFKEHRIKIPIK